jgi:hypothetical protein
MRYPRDNTKLDPFMHSLEIRTWGTKWKGIIDKTVEWAVWLWANAKIDKKKSLHNEIKCKHF